MAAEAEGRARALVLLLVGLRGFQAHGKRRIALDHAGLQDVGDLDTRIRISQFPSGMRSGDGSFCAGDSFSHTTLSPRDFIPGANATNGHFNNYL